MSFKIKINKDREFAIAYRLFSRLGDTPISASRCAKENGIPQSLMLSILKDLRDRGIVITKQGNVIGGTYKAPGVTRQDLFSCYGVPFDEGEAFEQKIEAVLAKYRQDKKCVICGRFKDGVNEMGCCSSCSDEGVVMVVERRMAKCGHFSTNRYFRCEGCQPVLEDNMTPEDWGVSMIT